MTVGLPGTGIGGVFYLMSAFFMPLFEIVKTVQGRSSVASWLVVLRHLLMGMAIIAGMWLLGLAAGVAYDFFVATKPVVPGVIHDIHAHLVNTVLHLNMFHIAPVIMSIVTLIVILTLTQILRIVIRPIASVEQS